MKIDLTLILAIFSIISVLFNIMQALKKDTKVDAVTQSTLSNDMKYVMRGIDNMTLEQKDFSRQQSRMAQDIIINKNEIEKALELGNRAYQHAESAHSRINKIGAN